MDLMSCGAASPLEGAIMQYLVEIRLADAGRSPAPGGGPAFIKRYLLPSLEICRRLEAEPRIVAGGPIGGATDPAFVVRAESGSEGDDTLEHPPLRPRMVTTVTPLEPRADRAETQGPRPERPLRGLIPGHVLVK
jgi:hypothetical protein